MFGVNFFFQNFILFGEFFGIFEHLFNLFLGKSALVVSNDDLFSFSSSLILGSDLQDTIGIDFEGDFNLRDTSGCGRDSGHIEFSEHVVIFDHGSFSFKYGDGDGFLVILVGGEGL